jgi:acyl-CoA hydrolase
MESRATTNFLRERLMTADDAAARLPARGTIAEISSIRMYTEVVQDSIFDLVHAGKLECASTSSLTFSPRGNERFQREIGELRRSFVIRPQEISNNLEVVRRMGIISMNTALEVDSRATPTSRSS